MTMLARVRRTLTVLVSGAAVAAGLAVSAAPAQAQITPFTFRLTVVHSGQVLAESSNLAGAAVTQQKAGPGVQQKWRFDFTSAATARLVNEEFPHLCMEPDKPTEISVVRMRPCSSTLPSAQLWRDHARSFNGEIVHQWSNLTSGMCLDVGEASQAPNALVIQFPCTTGTNQLFRHTII